MSSETAIEKDHPIPTTRYFGTEPCPLDQMQIGDSILIKSRSRVSTIRAQSYRRGMTIVTQTMPTGGIRIWRIK